MTVANDLRSAWDGKPCIHENVEKEYFGGAHGDYVCTQCGKQFDSREEARKDGEQQRLKMQQDSEKATD